MATLNNQPWYCVNGNSYWNYFVGCPESLPSVQDQVQMMNDNFGGSIDPTLKANALSDFKDWLTTSDYQGTLEQIKAEDNKALNPFNGTGIDWKTVLLGIGIVGVAMSTLGQSGPRKYGR